MHRGLPRDSAAAPSFQRRKPSQVLGTQCCFSLFPLSPLRKALSQGSSDSQILDLSNRFYTLIPHDFGMKKPPLLSNSDSVQVAPRSSREPRVPGFAGLGVAPVPLRLHVTIPEDSGQCWRPTTGPSF